MDRFEGVGEVCGVAERAKARRAQCEPAMAAARVDNWTPPAALRRAKPTRKAVVVVEVSAYAMEEYHDRSVVGEVLGGGIERVGRCCGSQPVQRCDPAVRVDHFLAVERHMRSQSEFDFLIVPPYREHSRVST